MRPKSTLKATAVAGIGVAALLASGCGTSSSPAAGHDLKPAAATASATSATTSSASSSGFSKKAVGKALGAPVESESDGVYLASIDRDDLHITRYGTKIDPSFDQDIEVYFYPRSGKPTMVMAEVPTTDREEARVVPALLAHGMKISAIHTHITALKPEVQWIHFAASGNATTIARRIHTVLTRDTATALPAKAGSTRTSLPKKRISKILGGTTTVDNGVVEVDVDRTDNFTMNGMPVPSDFGLDADIYFERIKGKMATTGEACVLASEVEPFLKTLHAKGLTITALHNHMIDTNPPTYFIHWFATGRATTLARDARAALNTAAYKKS